MSPPPGNKGGAVSGAGPCPLAVEARKNTRSDSHTHVLHYPEISRVFPPAMGRFQAHQSISRETTGGQTRCEVVGSRGIEEGRSVAMRCNAGQRRSGWEFPEAGITASTRGERKCHRGEAAQKERASSAWSCNNPDHDDRATSKALNCNTASPFLASSPRRSQMHISRERPLVPQAKLAEIPP